MESLRNGYKYFWIYKYLGYNQSLFYKNISEISGPVPSQNYRHKKMKPRVFHHKDTKVSFLFWALGCFQFVAGRQISVPLAAFGFRVPGHKSAGRFCRGFVWILAPDPSIYHSIIVCVCL